MVQPRRDDPAHPGNHQVTLIARLWGPTPRAGLTSHQDVVGFGHASARLNFVTNKTSAFFLAEAAEVFSLGTEVQ